MGEEIEGATQQAPQSGRQPGLMVSFMRDSIARHSETLLTAGRS